MDLVMLPAILNVLAPVLGALVFFACPVGIIWIVKNHQFRMKELEIEALRLGGPSPQQLAAIEARLASIESALALPARGVQDRAALLIGPATSAEAPAQTAALRTR